MPLLRRVDCLQPPDSCRDKFLQQHCRECGRNFGNARFCIEADTPRAAVGYYHIKCYAQSTNVPQPMCTWDLGYGQDFTTTRVFTNEPCVDERTKRKLYRYLFPCVIAPERRPLLSLTLKDIIDMTVPKLQEELRKRDLPRNGGKFELETQLMAYLDSPEIRTARFKYLARGYCRRTMKESSIWDNTKVLMMLKQNLVDSLGELGVDDSTSKKVTERYRYCME